MDKVARPSQSGEAARLDPIVLKILTSTHFQLLHYIFQGANQNFGTLECIRFFLWRVHLVETLVTQEQVHYLFV